VGKGSIIEGLLERLDRVWLSMSVTTRPQRKGEVDGRTYSFVDLAEFEKMERAGEFLESATVHRQKYGTPRRPVEEQLEQGNDVLLEIDVQGARQVKAKYPEAVTIFVEPPSLEELKRRLERRGSETPEEIAVRLEDARREIAEKHSFDFVVTNENLDTAISEVERLIRKAREGRNDV
jgi:guanylate kinase